MQKALIIILISVYLFALVVPSSAYSWGESPLETPHGTVNVGEPVMIYGGKDKKSVKVWSPRGKENTVVAEVPHGETVILLSAPDAAEAGKVKVRVGDAEGWVSISDVGPLRIEPITIKTEKKGTLTIPGYAYLDGRDLDAKVHVDRINLWKEDGSFPDVSKGMATGLVFQAKIRRKGRDREGRM